MNYNDTRWNGLTQEAAIRRRDWWRSLKEPEAANKRQWWDSLPAPWKAIHFRIQNRLSHEILKYNMMAGGGLEAFLSIIERELPPEGDILIAGTARGGDVMSIRQVIPKSRKIVVIDSFKGLDKPGKEDENPEMTMKQGALACSIDQYRQNFQDAGIAGPDEIYKMWITPESLNTLKQRPLALLFTDLDHYQPAKACYKHLIPWVIEGGVVLTHDYKFRLTPGVTQAAEEYAPGQWDVVYGSLARLRR